MAAYPLMVPSTICALQDPFILSTCSVVVTKASIWNVARTRRMGRKINRTKMQFTKRISPFLYSPLIIYLSNYPNIHFVEGIGDPCEMYGDYAMCVLALFSGAEDDSIWRRVLHIREGLRLWYGKLGRRCVAYLEYMAGRVLCTSR